MKNTTDKTAHVPVRNGAAERRHREMPLLFQLADVNRQAVTAAAVTAAAAPAPVDLPPLPGKFPPASFPLASSLFTSGQLDPWPTATTGMFESSSTFSTGGLSAGSAAAPSLGTQDSSQALPAKPTDTVPLTGGGLPAVIAAAVKAAAALNHPVEAPVEAKPEVATTIKPEVKAENKPEATPAPANEIKAEGKAEAPSEPPVAPVETKPAPLAAAPLAAAPIEVTVARSKSTPPAGEASAAPKPTTAPAEKPSAAAATTSAATAATADKPSPASLRRQRAEARQQKVDGKGGDWLQTHGKIIAIGFVIALVATIYLARRNRSEGPVTPAVDSPAGLAIEIPGDSAPGTPDQKPVEVANTAPRLTEPPSHPHDATPSPASTGGHSPASATAELQAPVVPSATQPTTAPTSEPLFPWQTETRTATAPQAPALVQPATSPAAAPNTAPALNAPTYPETNLRDAPLLPPAPPANAPPAPGTAPGTSSPAPTGGHGRGPATIRSYPASFTSAPDGNRYERTGSGLY